MEKAAILIFDQNLQKQCDRLPTILNRASIVQDLIGAYDLLLNENITVCPSSPATEDELKLFHSTAYVDFTKKSNNDDNEDRGVDDEQLEFGLGYDCPLLNNCFDLISTLAGASLTGAKLLMNNSTRTAINWCGGWHHANRSEASGFCYVNDISIAIQKLTEKFARILYVDLDIHHGDGVQGAFELTRKVLTLSFHKYSPGFFPGTGDLNDIGLFKGKHHSLNVPLKEGCGNRTYSKCFQQIFPRVVESYQPLAIVLQCGADCLHEDPLGQWNLTLETLGKCVQDVLDCQLPTLIVGGGGYNLPNTARYWTYLTSLIVEQQLSNDIPDTAEFFELYGPAYELRIDEGNQTDHNSDEYVNDVIETIVSYCQKIHC